MPEDSVTKTWEFDFKTILDSPRKVSGTFHIPVVDREKEFITSLAMEMAIPDFMHLPILHDFHKERPLGLITKVIKSGDEFKFEGILKSTTDVDDAWEKIQKGEYAHLSIAGARTKASLSCALPPGQRTEPCFTEGIRLDSVSAVNSRAINPLTSLSVQKAGQDEVLMDVTQLLYKAEDTDSTLMHTSTDYASQAELKEKEVHKCPCGKGKDEVSKVGERTAKYGVQQSAEVEHSSAKQPIGVMPPQILTAGQAMDGEVPKGPQSLEQKIDQLTKIVQQLVESDKKVHSSMDKAVEKVETGTPAEKAEVIKAAVEAPKEEAVAAVQKAEAPKEQPKEAPTAISKAELDTFEKAYAVKMDELTKAMTTLTERISKMENTKIEKSVVVIPEQLAAAGPIYGNAGALAAMKRS